MNDKALFWVKLAAKNTLFILSMCFVYGLFMCIGDDSISLTEAINDTIMFYFIIVSTVLAAIFCYTTIPMQIDLVMSLGSTRKDVFKHINVFIAVYHILITATFILLGLLSEKSLPEMLQSIITFIACLFISSGTGFFVGSATLKKGSTKGLIYILMSFISFIVPVLIITFSGTLETMTGDQFLSDFGQLKMYVSIGSIFAAIVLYTTGILKMKHQLNVHEVRI